jgi:Ca-activated chloride channel family protein
MKRAVFTVSLLLMGLTLTAQTPTALCVDVRLVNVVATVTDDVGRHVSQLSANDFSVFEDGVPQKITHFTQDYDVPVSVGILLDTSGSMQGKMSAATAAVERFINNVHQDDDIFLMTFARGIQLEQDFTSDRRKLSRALNNITISGGTVLYDALQEGLDKIRHGRHDKRAILVISDGFDAGSRKTKLDQLLGSIRSAEVLVYGLGTAPTVYADPAEHVPFTLPTQRSTARGPARVTNPRQGPLQRGSPPPSGLNAVNMNVMKQFAENSGGQAFLLTDTFIDDDGPEIDKVLTTIAAELRAQYTLGYYPSAPDNGKLHTIKITTSAGHSVRTRTGYLGSDKPAK